jgi:hypothetical protein
VIDVLPIPLPAALPLFATGIGALGLLGSAESAESAGARGCLNKETAAAVNSHTALDL